MLICLTSLKWSSDQLKFAPLLMWDLLALVPPELLQFLYVLCGCAESRVMCSGAQQVMQSKAIPAEVCHDMSALIWCRQKLRKTCTGLV